MANLKVNFMFGTLEKFNALAAKDADTLYFVEGQLYKGDVLYGGAHKVVDAYPETGVQGVLYCNTTDLSVKFWTGTGYHTVVPPIVTTITDAVTNEQLAAAKAMKEYVDDKIKDVVAGSIDGLGALASKDQVSDAELEATLKAKIDGAATGVTTLVGADTGKSAREIANEELAAQLIPEAAKESLDTLAEIAAWIQAHPDDAAAMNQSIADLEALVGTLPEDAAATTVVAYIKEYCDAAIAALKIGDYAKAADLTAAVGRIATLEGKVDVLNGTGEGSVAKALADAKDYADDLDTAMDIRVTAVETQLTWSEIQ